MRAPFDGSLDFAGGGNPELHIPSGVPLGGGGTGKEWTMVVFAVGGTLILILVILAIIALLLYILRARL